MIKQAIIVNLKANMPIGRLVAQVAHASELANDLESRQRLKAEFPDEFGPVTKTVLRGFGDEHLLELLEKSKSRNIPVAMMREDGFNTALAIGPAPKKKVDEITFGMLLL